MTREDGITVTRTPNGGYAINFPPHPRFPSKNDDGELIGACWHELTERGVERAIEDWNSGAWIALNARYNAGYPE